jgi:hypothetical protein
MQLSQLQNILLIAALALLVCIGPALVLVAALIRSRNERSRRRGFPVDPLNDIRSRRSDRR